MGLGSQPWICLEVDPHRPHSDLSIDAVKTPDAQLPFSSQLLGVCLGLRLRAWSHQRKRLKRMAPHAMQSMEWRWVRPRA